MNKQEVIEKVNKLKGCTTFVPENRWIRRDEVLNIIDQLEEPEKPVLTKEEAEWIDKLTDFYSLPDALYYITRCGYGHLFTFDFWGDTYELPVDNDTAYDETHRLKERLVNAVIYGYEVEKEKLYTVELPNQNGSGYSKIYLAKNKDSKVELFTWSGYTSIEFADNWKQEENAQLTESEIKKDFDWAWQFAKEVEE